jgi:pumilio RNA-binding family
MSTSSSLLTPTDLSPARSFELKLNSTYEFSPSAPHLSQSSLLEPSSPNKPHDILPPSDSPPYHRQSFSQSPRQPASNPFPFFEPFSERPSPAPTVQPLYSSPQISRRSDSSRVPQSWRQQQQFPTPSEWLRASDELPTERKSSLVGAENPLRSPVTYQYPNNPQAQNSSHAHEVNLLPSLSNNSAHLFAQSSRSIFSLFCTLLPRLPIMSL